MGVDEGKKKDLTCHDAIFNVRHSKSLPYTKIGSGNPLNIGLEI